MKQTPKHTERPTVLSIAGFDPCGGAGVLADIKTFELCRATGMGVVTGITYQTESAFLGVEWQSAEVINTQLISLLETYSFKAVKIGLVEDLDCLNGLVQTIRRYLPDTPIVLDPILSASAGYTFHDNWDIELFSKILTAITLLTPNWEEAKKISGNSDGTEGARQLSQYTNILLKGGHNIDSPGTDFLFYKQGEIVEISPEEKSGYPKHGSGCVLSAAIAVSLAYETSLQGACKYGKSYTYYFLNSTPSLLGIHFIGTV